MNATFVLTIVVLGEAPTDGHCTREPLPGLMMKKYIKIHDITRLYFNYSFVYLPKYALNDDILQ